MNIIHKITRKSLLKKRTRTFVTIIGIILSMGLFTTVIEGVYSGIQFFIRIETECGGTYHGTFRDLNKEKLDQVQNTEDIKGSSYWQQIGWAHVNDNSQEDSYLLIESMSDNFTDYVAVNINEGRMPKNKNEILLPKYFVRNSNVTYKIGDVISLSVENDIITDPSSSLYLMKPEEITDAKETAYTVVGTYESVGRMIERSYGCTALTVGGGRGNYDVFFTLKDPSKFSSFKEQQNISKSLNPHSELLAYYGFTQNASESKLITGFACVLIFLIAFGSISLIYNSFAISVSDRTKQIGILKSIGATKKQIRSSVLYEALFLGSIGIPLGLIFGCLGCGIGLKFLHNNIFKYVSITQGSTEQLRFVLNPMMLLLSAIICLITTLIAAWVPARKAMRISAIDSIRQTNDIKIKPKQLKTSKLTQKLFKFEGMIASKNFKRNKKRYRPVVFSIFLSVTLFISASAFCDYAIDLANTMLAVPSYDIEYEMNSHTNANPSEIFSVLMKTSNVSGGDFFKVTSTNIPFSSEDTTEEYRDMLQDSPFKLSTINVIFLNEESFAKICTENGLNSKTTDTEDVELALLYNTCKGTYSQNKNIKKYEISAYNEKKLSKEKVYELSSNENSDKVPFKINGIISKVSGLISLSDPTIIFPYNFSKEFEEKLNSSNAVSSTYFRFLSSNHSKTFEEMKAILHNNELPDDTIIDISSETENFKAILLAIKSSAYCFIILISFITLD